MNGSREIQSLMNNGFRADIKSCLEYLNRQAGKIDEIEKSMSRVEQQKEQVDKIKTIATEIKNQNSFWSKLTSILVAIAAITTLVYKLAGM